LALSTMLADQPNDTAAPRNAATSGATSARRCPNSGVNASDTMPVKPWHEAAAGHRVETRCA
jgi:hypothetical protein